MICLNDGAQMLYDESGKYWMCPVCEGAVR